MNWLKKLIQNALNFLRGNSATEPTQKPKRKPWHHRKQQTRQLIAIAWSRGVRTYEAIISFVKEQTGKKCSKRAIAAWKREQGLLTREV